MFPNGYYNSPGLGIGRSIGTSAVRGISFSGILNGATRTLSFVNQVVPLVYQAGPIVRNAKTMFKVAGAFKSIDSNASNVKTNVNNQSSNTPILQSKTNNNVNNNKVVRPITSGPMFFQ